MTLTVTSPATPERVFDFLTNPRNLVTGNHRGPVETRSDAAEGVGSWAVLAFDNLRARVEYTAWDRASRISATITWSGRFSGGRVEYADYQISPGPDGGTVIAIGNTIPVSATAPSLISRIVYPLLVRRWRRKFAQIT